jgi:hypothetical protein
MALLDLKDPANPDPSVTDQSNTNFGSAVSSPGALNSGSLSALNDPNYFTSGSIDTGTLGNNTVLAPNSGAPNSGDIGALTGGAGNVNVGAIDPGSANANLPTDPSALSGAAPPATATGSQGLNLGSLGSTLGGLAPSLAAGGIGLSQAKSAQAQSAQYAAQLSALGGPYTAAGQALLKQWQSQQITPTQQNVVNTLNQQGSALESSAAPLSAIAQQAYQNYQSGTLPAADEQRLSDQVNSQKQQVAQQLASAGITDSTILAGQYAQIDNQATITRQQLLDARFATGNVAYDQWLSSTTQGQALQAEAAKFASTSLDNMLQQSLGLGQEGMQPIESAIQLQIQSDAALSAQVNQLMGNLASAYAYQQTGGKPPASGGAAGGGVAGAAGSLLSGVGKALGAAGGSGSGGPSSTDISSIENSGLNYAVDATQQTAIDATAPATDPNSISGLASTVDTGNLGDTSSGPSPAGGEAATPDLGAAAANATAPGIDPNTISGLASTNASSGVDLGSLGAAAGIGAGAIGIYSGLTSGKPVGEAQAAVGATKLAGQAGLVSPKVNATAGEIGNVLGIYTGIKQGGVAGDAGAAVNAAQLGSKLGAFGEASGTVSTVAGDIAAPLALYNEVKTWQSGATGSDALAGAETGAAVGSIIPVVGTVIGAVVGGILGAVSSAFGSGKPGAAAGSWNQLTASNALSSTPGRNFTSQSWSEAFKGMLDEGNNIFSGGGADRHKDPDALAKPLEAQIKSGMAQLGPSATTDQVYNQVIVPWMQTSGSGLNWSVLKNEPQQQLMIKSAVDRVLAGEPIVRTEIDADNAAIQAAISRGPKQASQEQK